MNLPLHIYCYFFKFWFASRFITLKYSYCFLKFARSFIGL